jgi:hypothetical protein
LSDFLNHPAVQGGVAPFVVALIVAALLGRTRFAWFAIIAGYLTRVILATGISFSPLTAGRKILLLGILAPLIGVAADTLVSRARPVAMALTAVAGFAAAWVFLSVLSQQPGERAWLAALGLVLFAAAMVWSMVTLRDDPLRSAVAGLGLGLAVGIAAVLSASIGFLLSGVAVAAASGALLLYWVVMGRPVAPGLLGTLSIGVMIALFAEGALMLAEMPWYGLATLLLIPLAVRLPVPESASVFVRALVLSLYALAAASVPIAAAWLATGSAT